MSEKKPNNMVWINKISEKQISAGVEGKYGPSVRIPCGDGKFGQAFIAAKTPATTKDGDVIEGKFNVALAERAKVLFKSEEDAKAVAEISAPMTRRTPERLLSIRRRSKSVLILNV